MQAENALNTSQAQVASGKVATDYAGIGDKTAVLEAARSAADRADAYQTTTQPRAQSGQLAGHASSRRLSDLANQLRQDDDHGARQQRRAPR